MKEAIRKSEVLIEALPYIKKFHKKITVIKYGGSILAEERVRRSVLEDMVFLKYTGIRPILVHGGGPMITEKLREKKIASEFVDGMRVTDRATLEVVESELNRLNELIVEEISSHNIKAKGLKRKDNFIYATKKKSKKELGFVGTIIGFDRQRLERIIVDAIPVICPMGISSDGVVYNINADEIACFLASQLRAEKLVYLTNVLGVMRDSHNDDSLISTLSAAEAEELIAEKVIDEGMVPKVRGAVEAIKGGVKKVHIIDAKIPHALLLEIFTDEGIGTEIVH